MAKVPSGACFGFALCAAFLLLLLSGRPALCERNESDCSSAQTRWERALQDLKEKLDDFEAIRRTPVERLIKRPLVEAGVDKSIARQVSEALQMKEDMLNEKRKECLNILNLEEQTFTEVERCAPVDRSGGKKDIKRLAGQRGKLIQRARTAIAETQEVEGKDGYSHYVDSWKNPSDFYGRGPGSNWQNYRQTYQGY